jgi:hypothetical protein
MSDVLLTHKTEYHHLRRAMKLGFIIFVLMIIILSRIQFNKDNK